MEDCLLIVSLLYYTVFIIMFVDKSCSRWNISDCEFYVCFFVETGNVGEENTLDMTKTYTIHQKITWTSLSNWIGVFRVQTLCMHLVTTNGLLKLKSNQIWGTGEQAQSDVKLTKICYPDTCVQIFKSIWKNTKRNCNVVQRIVCVINSALHFPFDKMENPIRLQFYRNDNKPV